MTEETHDPAARVAELTALIDGIDAEIAAMKGYPMLVTNRLALELAERVLKDRRDHYDTQERRRQSMRRTR